MRNQLGSDGDFLYARSTSRESLKNFLMAIFSMPDQPAEKVSKICDGDFLYARSTSREVVKNFMTDPVGGHL